MKMYVLWLVLIAHISSSVQQMQPYCTKLNNTGPALPELPDQYMTVIEANIVDRNMTVTGHEYFDRLNNRATMQMFKNNYLFSLIFDYEHDQLFYVNSSGSCTTSDIEHDPNNVFFGNQTMHGIPHVFTTGGALHFAKQYGEEYLGQEEVRGIMCDHWRSCQYWPQVKSNFTLDYYFTVMNWTDPINSPQIPVRAVANGTQFMDENGGIYRDFLHYYEFIDFRTTIPEKTDVFETPKGVVCEGRKVVGEIPTLPRFYHYRQEIVEGGSNKIYQADVWYDQVYRYIRYDYRTPKPIAPLKTTNPVTEIHDYNYGIRYVRDQITGQCVSAAITNSSFDVAENTTTFYPNGTRAYVIHMKDPMALFYLNSNYTYTGKRVTRGLQCKVYTTIRDDYYVPGVGRKSAIFEYYFLDDNFVEIPDDGPSKPQNVPVYLEVTVTDIKFRVQYNFVDFDETHPDLSIFDVSSCYSESAKLQFQVRFPGSYTSGTSKLLLLSAGDLLRAIMQVKALRVQDLRLDYDNSQIYVSATLLDRSPYTAQFTYLSDREIEYHDDAKFGSDVAHNSSDCSRLCVTNKNFTCNSFDFCPMDPAGVCRLSKSHIGDGGIRIINSTCGHFSRTVNGPAKQELSIQQAYTLLQRAVNTQQLAISVSIPGIQNPIQYVAVDIKVTFGWLTPKPIPKLSGQFSYHLEITVPELEGVFNSHIYYDSDFKLVRYDLVNTQPSPPLFTVDPISTIHDYNSGLAYTLDKKEGNCSIAPITNSSFDVGVVKTAGFVVKMKSPLDLFYLNGTYKYAGQRTVRGILCDVFEDVRTDFRFGNNPLAEKAVFQFYFMSNDWQELSEDDGTSVNSQPIALVISSFKGSYTLTYNFYDFSEQHPDLTNFDIRPCYAGKQLRHFLIKFLGSYHPTLDTNLKQFTKNIQQMLTFYTSASFLRFQDPSVTYIEDGYVYYLATMVEQAPYLLDFTKTSNNVAVYPADKTIPNVHSDFTCAAFCRNETTFDCESFDYCPSAMKCQLSKKHGSQSGPTTRQSDICDHYSKTVDVVAPIEPTIDEAFVILKDLVYTRGLNVTVHQSLDGKNVMYHAVLFDEDILRPDSTATTSATLQHFLPFRRRVILSKIDLQLKGLSVDQCATRCLAEATFDCQSFDYCFDTGRCIMSQLHPDQNAKLVVTHAMCDLYARSYLDSYTAYPGKTLQTPGDVTITDITSTNFCASKCSKSTGIACKSFDFCSGSNTCILKSRHVLDVSKTALKTSFTCSHFSRKYIHDFDETQGRIFSTGQDIQFSNVSKDGCAKLCVENSGIMCLAFSYCEIYGCTYSSTDKTSVNCRMMSDCIITSLNPVLNRDKISSNRTCSLYHRKYFPTASANTGKKQQQSDSDSGYSGGAMAGLAVGMLIPGMVIGAALLYYIRTKKLVEEEQLRMGYLNSGIRGGNDDDLEHIHEPADADLPAPHTHSYDTSMH